MSKKPTRYVVVTGCAKDQPDGTTKRFGPGDVITTSDFTEQEIEWLLNDKRAIKVKEANDKSR
jgi:hypothetical protein